MLASPPLPHLHLFDVAGRKSCSAIEARGSDFTGNEHRGQVEKEREEEIEQRFSYSGGF